MQVSTSGIIILEKDISENDKLVTVLTKDWGVIRAFAKGAKKLKNKNFSALSLFSYSDLVLYKGRDKYIINDAYLKKSFFELRKNIGNIALSQYFCEVVLALVGESPESENVLRLILNSFYYLMEEKQDRSIIKSVFEMRVLSMSGYMPDLTMCANCGKFSDTKMNFVLTKGQLICSDCSKRQLGTIELNSDVLAALRYTVYAEFNKMFSFTLSNENKKRLARITEQYLLHCVDKNLKTLDFYNRVNTG